MELNGASIDHFLPSQEQALVSKLEPTHFEKEFPLAGIAKYALRSFNDIRNATESLGSLYDGTQELIYQGIHTRKEHLDTLTKENVAFAGVLTAVLGMYLLNT